jgi:hypothetical protein
MNIEKITTYDFGNPDPVFGRHKNEVGLNRLLESQNITV